jgi:hypothetical protein
MAELDTLAGALASYHLYHATRAEQAVLQQRLTWTQEGGAAAGPTRPVW